MPQFQTRRRVAHSVENMFELVADVERYPEFVPLCENLRIVGRSREGEHEVVTARMTVAYKLLREGFTSRIVLDRSANEIRVSYIDGPFRYLENVWSFRPIEAHSCEIGFRISYEFRSRILQKLMGAMFDRAFRKFADAFEARADRIYGKAASGADAPGGEPPALKATRPASAS